MIKKEYEIEKKNEIEIKNKENRSKDYYFCGCADNSCLIHVLPIKK